MQHPGFSTTQDHAMVRYDGPVCDLYENANITVTGFCINRLFSMLLCVYRMSQASEPSFCLNDDQWEQWKSINDVGGTVLPHWTPNCLQNIDLKKEGYILYYTYYYEIC